MKGHFDGGKNLYEGGRKSTKRILDELLPYPLVSAASAGGAATETLAVDGLDSTLEILSATMTTPGAVATSALVSVQHGTSSGDIDCSFAADPGAGAIITLLVRNPSGA